MFICLAPKPFFENLGAMKEEKTKFSTSFVKVMIILVDLYVIWREPLTSLKACEKNVSWRKKSFFSILLIAFLSV